ncbi:hypothetical protein ACQEU8_28700 [Streptomyces sp. CA-250714]|uniref:hypothetical protein n=1 Tax=Streptomyces sp. CA-250714 TaxID=3240060 RepID=UPI003D89E166
MNVELTTSEGFRYRFSVTGASLNPTGDSAEPDEPADPGTTYIVVRGRLHNLLEDRPAPRYPSILKLGDHLSVTAPQTAVKRAVPAGKARGTKNCRQLTWRLSGVTAGNAANRSGVCFFRLSPSVVDADDDATIRAGKSAAVTFTALVPDALPKGRMRLAVSTTTGKTTSPGTTIGQDKALQWLP